TNNADGRVTVQDTRSGWQGDLGAPPGIQSDPRSDGRGRAAAQRNATPAQPSGGATNLESISGRVEPRSAASSIGTDRSGAHSNRASPSRRPPRSCRAKGRQASTKAVPAHAGAAQARPKAFNGS